MSDEQFYKFCPNCKTELQNFHCPNCEFVFWNNPKPVGSILIEKDGKILMIQRANEPLKDYWCLPGGYITYGESPEEAVVRELKEETDLAGTIGKLIGVYRIDNDPRGKNIDIIYSGTAEGEVALSSEHSHYNFFSPTELPDKIAYKHREAISHIQKAL